MRQGADNPCIRRQSAAGKRAIPLHDLPIAERAQICGDPQSLGAALGAGHFVGIQRKVGRQCAVLQAGIPAARQPRRALRADLRGLTGQDPMRRARFQRGIDAHIHLDTRACHRDPCARARQKRSLQRADDMRRFVDDGQRAIQIGRPHGAAAARQHGGRHRSRRRKAAAQAAAARDSKANRPHIAANADPRIAQCQRNIGQTKWRARRLQDRPVEAAKTDLPLAKRGMQPGALHCDARNTGK